MVLNIAAEYSAYHKQVLLTGFDGVHSVGEDAFFKSKNFIGVSDGVSSWSIDGKGNSAYLAYYLMAYAKFHAENESKDTTEQILNKAYDEVWARYRAEQLSMPSGSATICLVRLLEDNGNFSLSYAAIGDSMVIVIRPEQIGGKYALKVVHQSVRKYVSVRAVIPMQLLFAPQRTPKENVNKSTMESSVQKVSVLPGDIVIVATDGLWDNLSASLSARALQSYLNKPKSTEDDRENSHQCHNKNFTKGTPTKDTKSNNSGDNATNPASIAKRLVEQALQRNKKLDDITVVVGVVSV